MTHDDDARLIEYYVLSEDKTFDELYAEYLDTLKEENENG